MEDEWGVGTVAVIVAVVVLGAAAVGGFLVERPTVEGNRELHLDFLSSRHTFETTILGSDGLAANVTARDR